MQKALVPPPATRFETWPQGLFAFIAFGFAGPAWWSLLDTPAQRLLPPERGGYEAAADDEKAQPDDELPEPDNKDDEDPLAWWHEAEERAKAQTQAKENDAE